MNNKNNRGYILIFLTILFTSIVSAVVVGSVNPTISDYSAARDAASSRMSFMAADSGVEDAIYRLKNNKTIGSSQSLTLDQGSANVTVTNTTNGKRIDVSAQVGDYQKNVRVNLSQGTGVSFHYGIQAGQGGFNLENSSSITGNVFSSGPITGSSNLIRGDVVSAGASGLISGIHATGTAHAHTIQNSTIDKDAYYVTKTNTTVLGTSYPNSPDQTSVDLPISDAQIAQWENEAAQGGNATCVGGKYIVTSSTSLGPKKIPCDFEVSGSPVITVGGPIWVTGDITFQNSPTIRVSSSQGSQSVAIIADNPANRSGSGIIEIKNSTTFQGSGTPGSFVFMISQNNSAENGGSTKAIDLANSSNSLIAYAAHGLIVLANSVSVKEATAYKINLKNSANVRYDTGLVNTLFSAGPGGGYDMIDWTEI